jgi:DNA-binding CsgD family transcriptional regulator
LKTNAFKPVLRAGLGQVAVETNPPSRASYSSGDQVKSNVALIRNTEPDADKAFFFYEKTSPAIFKIQAGPRGELPLEQAAGMLAMHCMVRNQSPQEYSVMVPSGLDNFTELVGKTQKLLEAGRLASIKVKLTRREQEVLSGAMRSLSNKEIAAALNLAERTVKFHMSSLLSKYGVRGRMELVRVGLRDVKVETAEKTVEAAVAAQTAAAEAKAAVPKKARLHKENGQFRVQVPGELRRDVKVEMEDDAETAAVHGKEIDDLEEGVLLGDGTFFGRGATTDLTGRGRYKRNKPLRSCFKKLAKRSE